MRAGNRDLYTMQADGSGTVQRTSDPAHELDPDWSRDGRALVAEVIPDTKEGGASSTFVEASTFVIAPLDGGPMRTIRVPGDFVHWSPTEDLIAYHSAEGLQVTSPAGESRLLVPNSPTGEEAFYAAWSPDGKTIYYVARSPKSSSIRAVPVTGGPSRLLVQIRRPHPAAYPLRLQHRRPHVLLHHGSAGKRHLGRATGGAVRPPPFPVRGHFASLFAPAPWCNWQHA